MDTIERTDRINIPRRSGKEGLLRVVDGIISEIPRVKRIVIHGTGTVEYTWQGPTDHPTFALDLQEFRPAAILRQVPVHEVVTSGSPKEAISSLLFQCDTEHLYPICFVAGSVDYLRKWSGLLLQDTLLGYSLLEDAELPPEALLVHVCHARSSSVCDTYCAFKLTLPTLETQHDTGNDPSSAG